MRKLKRERKTGRGVVRKLKERDKKTGRCSEKIKGERQTGDVVRKLKRETKTGGGVVRK